MAAAPRRALAARALVESAVRSWRYKYPTSKVDDCAVVCLFLDSDSDSHKVCSASNVIKSKEQPSSGTCRENNEDNNNNSEEESKEEEIDTDAEIEWSALEGVSRVNTLLNLPRFEPDKEDKGMRKHK